MSRTLSQGMTGQDVRALQDVLNFHIRRLDSLTVDGVFGAKTLRRVQIFQQANGLKADGLVGPMTNAQLFEITELPVPIVFLPAVQLDPLKFGASQNVGIQPPQLVPPLQWPGPPMPPPFPVNFASSFNLFPDSSTLLPALTGPANALGLKVTMPTRKDPGDPTVASRQFIIQLINDLPVDSKFRAFLTSQVPNPVTTISAPPSGFKWGLDPLFTPINPSGFGVKGNAQFLVHLTDGANGMPNVLFGAWGDGKFFLDFDKLRGQSRPTAQAEGKLLFGVRGTF